MWRYFSVRAVVLRTKFLCVWLWLAIDRIYSESLSCTETWFIRNESTGECQCGHSIDGVVSCDEKSREVKILDCYCMNVTVVGVCFSSCINASESYSDHVYKLVPPDYFDPNNSNNSMCNFYNKDVLFVGNAGKATDFKCILTMEPA